MSQDERDDHNLLMISEQKDKDSAARLSNSLKPHADTDKKGEAAKNPAGELDVKSGEIYYGSGDYQSASTAISCGIQKGQIKHLNEAYVWRMPADATRG